MTRFTQLTSRNLLIAIHDALATGFALFASFYLRFEGSDAFFTRLPLLLRVLPYFIVFSVVVCYVCKVTTTKWRFISLPDALNILRAASVLTLALVVMDYVFIFIAPSSHGPVFLGRVTIVLYWFLEVFSLSALRFGYRYFRYAGVGGEGCAEGASTALLIGRAADAEVLLRGIESGAVKQLWPVGVLSPSIADRGQSIRDVPVLGGIDDVEDVIRDYARRGKPIARVVMTPSAFDPDAHPESVLMRAKRLGLIVSRLPSLESGDVPRLTNVVVEDLLLRSSEKIDYARLEALVKGKAVMVTGGGGSVGSGVCDRVAAGAEAMVMVPTDKAIEPVSMLGLTKRFAEMYCQALDSDLAAQADGKRHMRLISVRFGNVLASNGSVVPKFKAQIEAGGPVTVTHPDMVRYFMTIREACDLVLTAVTHALTPARPDVSVYVLNMGQPVKIVELAERMIRLSGLEPGLDIEEVFSGMRPGERLNETLFASQEPTV